jgi:hypothetical protein
VVALFFEPKKPKKGEITNENHYQIKVYYSIGFGSIIASYGICTASTNFTRKDGWLRC